MKFYLFVFLILLSFAGAADHPLVEPVELNRPVLLEKSSTCPLMEIVDRRDSLQRMKAEASANLRILGAMFKNFLTRCHVSGHPHNTHIFIKPTFCENTGEYLYPEENFPWNRLKEKENGGLCLFIHGLRGIPHDWHEYLVEMKRRHPDVYCLAPYVLLEGNCSLKEAAAPLLRLVQDYARKNPGKPIILIGTSNGGRIAMYLETQLRVEDLEYRQLTVVSLAGVHYGTQFIDYLASWKLLWAGQLDQEIAKDFSWKSETARQCLEAWSAKQALWHEHGIHVRHLFCATTEDGQVYPQSCSLPQAPPGSSCDYRIYVAENHLSIVPAACHDVMNWIDHF